MEWLLPLAVLTGLGIGWLTLRNRPMNAEDRIRRRFRDLVDDMCDSFIARQIDRPLELLEVRPYRDNGFIQFRIATSFGVISDRYAEPDLLIIKT